MPTEYIGEYLVEYSGERLRFGKGWGAHVAIYDVTRNPAFRASLFPKQRVCLETEFLTEAEATARAREIAVMKIGRSSAKTR